MRERERKGCREKIPRGSLAVKVWDKVVDKSGW